MNLKDARVLATYLCTLLAPFCSRVRVVGSIRRRKSHVHDIDVVAIPDESNLMSKGFMDVRTMVSSIADSKIHATRSNGLKMSSFYFSDFPVDIYWATPETWATLLLIRTGSKEHNIRLCTTANQKGMHLYASGDGLFKDDVRIAGDTERSIFNALDLPYLKPNLREVRS